MPLPIYLTTVFTVLMVSIIVLLLALTVFLFWIYFSTKKEMGEGKLDFDVLEDKVAKSSRSPKMAKWCKAGSVLANIGFLFVLLLCGTLIFTRVMPGLGIPYSMEAIRTGSMSKVDPSNECYLKDHDDRIQVNDIVILKEVKTFDEVELYDVISYRHPQGINVIHRVVFIGDGYYMTRGDAVDKDDNIRVTLDMVNGVYTGTRIPFFGSITFYLQDDYGILGMSAIAYCIIAYEIYSGFNDKLRENRIKTYDTLFKEGVSKITYSSPDGTIEFDANYQGSVDKKKKSDRVDIKYTRSSAK